MNKMEKRSVMSVLLPVILIVLMLLDGQISNILRGVTNNQLFLNSHLLLIGLILGSLYFERKYMVILSISIGILFDVYYYSIIGINMVSLPLTVLLIYVVFEYVRPSFISILLSLVIFITIMDSSAYLLQGLFGLINSDFLGFVTRNLGPTMILNGLFYTILAYPIKKIAKL